MSAAAVLSQAGASAAEAAAVQSGAAAVLAAPQVTYLTQPAAFQAEPMPYLVDQQAVTYVDENGQPVTFVDEQGNPVNYGAGQAVTYVDENGQPVTFVDEYGNPVVDPNLMQYGAVQYEQPAVFNVSPELFARLAQGGSLTQEEVDALTGAAPAAVAEAPAAPEAAEKKKKSSKKSLSAKSKKSKGCC